jgi:hypothetical protein
MRWKGNGWIGLELKRSEGLPTSLIRLTVLLLLRCGLYFSLSVIECEGSLLSQVSSILFKNIHCATVLNLISNHQNAQQTKNVQNLQSIKNV